MKQQSKKTILVKVGQKWAIVLPSQIRKNLGIEVGDYLTAEAQNNGILLKPAEVVEKKQNF